MSLKTDFLIIGSGIAGLTYALKTARALPQKRITIICKSQPIETNTRYAQGGIAAVSDLNKDSIEKHIQDTLTAGGSLCDKKVVEIVVNEGATRLAELIGYGVNFDRTRYNSYDLAREGGHSCNRIFHKGDFTGLEIEKKLLAEVRKMPNIKILGNTTAIDLITEEHLISRKNEKGPAACYGAFILDGKNKIKSILSKITLLATGGAGQVFLQTTNPSIATGDGVAMASRAKARIKHMEFIQFHPTALYQPGRRTNFLISEAVRGFGATLKTADGNPFMQHYDKRGDLATRDIVSRAIDSEIRKNKLPNVFLDCTKISKKDFLKHFPTIATKCINMGIDPARKMIPITPSAHYCCGGVETDLSGRTSVNNLYASGECAYTGLHGSNRLASNSLLEALVFSHRAYLDSVKKIELARESDVSEISIPVYGLTNKTVNVYEEKLKTTMSQSIGITTSFEKLETGLKTVAALNEKYKTETKNKINPKVLEVRNMMDTSLIILKSAMLRTVNKGVFYNIDLARSHNSNKKQYHDINLQKK